MLWPTFLPTGNLWRMSDTDTDRLARRPTKIVYVAEATAHGSACFHNALVLVGRRVGYDLTGSTVATKVGIGPNDAKGYGLAVAVNVSLPLLDQELAARLVEAAHDVCPYSNATRGNIDISIMLS